MGALVTKQEITRIELPDGEWVDVKKRVAYGSFKSIKKQMDEDKALIESITAWNILDEKGDVLQITVENLERLDTRVIRMISEEAVKSYSPLAPASTSISGNTSGEPQNESV